MDRIKKYLVDEMYVMMGDLGTSQLSSANQPACRGERRSEPGTEYSRRYGSWKRTGNTIRMDWSKWFDVSDK